MVKRIILCMGADCLQLGSQEENDKKIQGDVTMKTLKTYDLYRFLPHPPWAERPSLKT